MSGMKTSSIDWAGAIPAEWAIRRVKDVLRINNGREVESEEGNTPVYGSGGAFKWTNRPLCTEPAILVGRKGTVDRPLLVEQPFWTVDTMFFATPIKSISLEFIYYCATCFDYAYYQTGSTLPSMTQSDLGSIFIPFPSISEQKKIAGKLKKLLEDYDVAIGSLEKEIAILERYQASVIHEAVTKGLNPNVPMKSSGIDWIGNIPEKWEVKRLKYVINFFDNLRAPIEASLRSQEGEILYPYYGASGAIDVIDDYNVTGEMLLVGEDGANLVRRTLPLVYLATGRYWVNNHAHILHPISGNLQYYFHALEACDYTLYITGSAQPKLSQQNLMNVWLPVPPVDEQVAIGDYLNSRIVAIDTVLETKRKQINVLKRRRQSLIYEYVTGKRRVGKEI